MVLRNLFKGLSSSAASAPPGLPSPAPRSSSPPIRPKRGIATWVPAGESTVVDGRLIAGGMVYVGSGVQAVSGYGTEPCLIDPSLQVRWNNPDWTGDTMGYWPSYSEIGPSARAAYLSWLENGRKDKSAYIGYVFLFFYGFERRLIGDLKCNVSHPEARIIVAEIERLIGIYDTNRSFSGYANGLLDFVKAQQSIDSDVQPVQWDPTRGRSWEVPNAVLAGIGKHVARGLGIPAEWALSYIRHHPAGLLRTPATRCHEEFDELFKARYRERFGEGIRVRPLSRKLTFSYKTASDGFLGEVSTTAGDIPDVNSAPSLLYKLRDLGKECSDDLDAYSRFLGRRPDETGTAAAIALLPNELLASHGGQILDDLRSWTSNALAGGPSAVVPLDELVQQWSPGRVEKLAKRDAVSLATLLGKVGVGVEPDVRFGASTPKPSSEAVLFQLTDGAATAPSSEYTAAMSLVHLTAVVAAADGSISPSEQQHLAEHAEKVLGLDAAECARLEAHLAFLATGKLGMAGIKRKVEALPTEEREAVGKFLIDVAAADGVVSPEEISTLTSLFRHLGLDEGDVFRQVHALGTSDLGPVTVLDAEPTTRWAVPEPVEDFPQPPSVFLDPAKVQARLAETARVSALLADIFADDDPLHGQPAQSVPDMAMSQPPSGPNDSYTTPEPTIAGLNAAHSALATKLATKMEWDLSEVENLAESLGLPFLDGALDIINEAAMDACGEPLIEGDDPLELNQYALEELL